MTHCFPHIITPVFTQLLERVVATCRPEKIFLLAVCEQKQFVRSVFTENPFERQAIASCELLALMPESEKRSRHELQDMMENSIDDSLPATVIVLPVQEFNDWLCNGHPFACRVYNNALLCYDAGTTPLTQPAQYNARSTNEEALQELDRHCRLAAEFLSGAELFVIRKNYGLAAFHLHQAAEQSYAGIIHFISGWRPQTHSIAKLNQYAQYLLPGLSELFPNNTEQEKRLFQYLQKAYADPRYKKDYSIKYADLSVLQDRVKRLLSICQHQQRSTAVNG